MSQYCDHLDVSFCERDSFEAIFDDAPDYVGFAQAVTSTRILGYFASVEALTEAVPNPNIGDTYGIGEEAPFNLYVYSANGWIDNGVPSGPPGPPGPQGNDGAQGPPGPAAAVTAWEVKYQASASGTTIPTGTWSENIPEVPDGQFLWTRTQVTYSDGTTTTSYSVVRGAGGGAVTRDAIIDALGYTPADDATAMVYKVLTFDGSAFKDADGNTLTYAQIKAFCLDTKNFVYAQYANRLYIPQYISNNNIFFESSYIDSDIPYMHRLGINNANQTSNQTIRLTKSTETTAIATRVETVEGIASNLNLLHNWWFGSGVINQKGVTSQSSDGYMIDRWRINRSDNTITLNTNGLIIKNNNTSIRQQFEQRLEKGVIRANTAYTASIKLQSGQIFYGTITTPETIPTSGYIDIVQVADKHTLRIAWGSITDSLAVMVGSASTLSIVAVKLEYGSVSTLTNDHAPDQSVELLKCWRYKRTYKVQTASYDFLALGFARSTTSILFTLPIPGMRGGSATITISDINDFKVSKTDTNASNLIPITAITGFYRTSETRSFTVTASGLTVGQPYMLLLGNNGYIEFANEL